VSIMCTVILIMYGLKQCTVKLWSIAYNEDFIIATSHWNYQFLDSVHMENLYVKWVLFQQDCHNK
jgi:hypothetical protein